jgi:hypothetical protein
MLAGCGPVVLPREGETTHGDVSSDVSGDRK